MAEFCRQCCLRRGMPGPGDFAGLINKREYIRNGGLGVTVLCEGCGVIRVDHTGACISSSCAGHTLRYLTAGDKEEKMRLRPVTEVERIILEKVAKGRGITRPDHQYEIAFVKQGNFTVAVLKTVPADAWAGEGSISLGVTKRNPIDADCHEMAEVLAMCRALENGYIGIDDGH